jgi:hypothetical protein
VYQKMDKFLEVCICAKSNDILALAVSIIFE